MMACGTPQEEASVLYQKGRQLREADQPVEAMKAFIAATRVPSDEYMYKGRSFSNMATMCRIGERHDLAYTLYEHSAELFLLAQDTLAYAFALNNMAWEQAVTGNKASVLALVDSAVRICPDEWLFAKVRETQAAACLYAGEYDSVLHYTRNVPVESVYFDMLRAQAYTFMEEYDSAIYYAQRVVEQTDNPRYLDDAYYILTQCDSTANADDIRALAATRTDIQRSLERNNTDWIEAMRLAEEALQTQKSPMKWTFPALVAGIVLVCCILAYAGILVFRRKRADTLEQQCRRLKHSKNLRAELQLQDYARFSDVCNKRLSGIVEKLSLRDMTEREIRICVLVLIGLSYAEIAEILFRAESGIGKDKYTIAKKLGVSVKDLQTTLRQIANES